MVEFVRWQQLWQEAASILPQEKWWHELQAHYTAPARAYHTRQHLAECLAHFDSVRPLVEQPTAVEIAIWGHDVIYEPQRSDNEEASAQWTQQLLQEVDASPALIEQVTDLIRLTRHVAEPREHDGALLLDIDLAILGAAPEPFAEYEAQIRHEYEWVAWPAFCSGRATILRTFLQRPTIYRSHFFQTRFEVQARANLARSLAQLTQGTE